jgi:cytochrome b
MGVKDEQPSGDLAWDWPARITHWGFGLSMSAAFWTAWRNDPESVAFKYHLPLGCLAAWFLTGRILLGFFGGPLSRWRRWRHSPAVVAAYFGAVARGLPVEPAGVNPGTLLFAPLAWLAVPLLILTGYVADWSEIWHARIAWGGAALVGCHLLGLSLHALRHQRLTPLAMVHGRRVGNDPRDRAESPRVAISLAWLAASVSLAGTIWFGFDPLTCVWRILPGVEIAFPLIQKG